MASIFSNFGNRIGNAFTSLGQGGTVFNADPTQIASLSDEDKKRFRNQGMQRFLDSLMMASAIQSENPQRLVATSNMIRQRKADQEDAKRKADLKKRQDEFIKNNPDKENMIEMNRLFGFSDTSKRKSTADIDNYNYYQSLSPEDKKVYLQLKRLDEDSIEGLERSKKKGQQGGVVVPPIQMEIDKAFGVDAVEYLGGGQAQIEANINNLKDKIRILKSGELNVSGPMVGNIPESVQSFTNPAALSFIGDIRDIVFQSLREKLGAQFTEKEGDRLVAAAFDQRLPEAENVKRLERLLKTIEGAASSKEDMIAYFRREGTLDGYEQKALTFDSIFDSIVQSDFSNKSDAELKAIFENGDKATKDAVIRFLEEKEK